MIPYSFLGGQVVSLCISLLLRLLRPHPGLVMTTRFEVFLSDGIGAGTVLQDFRNSALSHIK